MGFIIIIAIIAVWFFYSRNMAKKKDPNANFGSIIWEMMVVLFKLSVKFFKYITDKDNQERILNHQKAAQEQFVKDKERLLKDRIHKCEQIIRELESRPSSPDTDLKIAELESKIADAEYLLTKLQVK